MNQTIKYLKKQVKTLDDLYRETKDPIYESSMIGVQEAIRYIKASTFKDEYLRTTDDMLDVAYELDFDKYDYEINIIRIEKWQKNNTTKN